MKNPKNIIAAAAIVILLVAIVFAIRSKMDGPLPEEKKAFNAVSKHLDLGGNFLLYMKTDAVNERIEELLKDAESALEDPGMRSREVNTVLAGATMIFEESGIKDVASLGISNAEIDKGVFRRKAFLLKNKDADGLLWNIFGTEERDLKSLEMLPATTVLATAGEFDHRYLWKWLKDQRKNGNPELAQGFSMMVEGLKQNPDLLDVAKDLGTHFGVFVTLDDKDELTLPMDGETITIPYPSACVFVELKDEEVVETIVDMLERQMPIKKKKIEGKQAYVMAANVPAGPYSISPTIVAADGFMLIGLTTEIVEDTLAVMAGEEDGLVSTKAFKTASKGIPLKGNFYSYMGPGLNEVTDEVLGKATKKLTRSQAKLVKSLVLGGGGDDKWSFGVMSMSDDGLAIVSRSTDNGSSSMLFSLAGAPIAVGAGMALPVLSKARVKARRANSAGNLKQLALALLGYSGDYGGFFPVADGAEGFNHLVITNDMPISKVYVNPRDTARVSAFNSNADRLTESMVSYAYVGSGLRDDNYMSTEVPVAWEKPCGDNWVNVLFIDGHVEGRKSSTPIRSNVDVVEQLSLDRNIKAFFIKKARKLDAME